MQISSEIPVATAAELQPLPGEDQPTAVLRVVGALGGIAQTKRPNGRMGNVLVTDPALVRQVLVRGSMDDDLGLIRNFALRTADVLAGGDGAHVLRLPRASVTPVLLQQPRFRDRFAAIAKERLDALAPQAAENAARSRHPSPLRFLFQLLRPF